MSDSGLRTQWGLYSASASLGRGWVLRRTATRGLMAAVHGETSGDASARLRPAAGAARVRTCQHSPKHVPTVTVTSPVGPTQARVVTQSARAVEERSVLY